MRRGGIEPPTSRLSTECSAAELTARFLTSILTPDLFPVAGLRIELSTSGYEPDRDASPCHPQSISHSTSAWLDLNQQPPWCEHGALAIAPQAYHPRDASRGASVSEPAWSRTTDLLHVRQALSAAELQAQLC